VIRNIVAVIVGLFVGMAVNMALIMLNGYVLFPMPSGMDMNDPAQLNEYVATLPTAGFLVPLAAHLGQSFVGGCVAARLGSSRPILLAMIVGLCSLAGGAYMMTTVDGPSWMVIELPLYLVVAWLAGRMEVNRRATTAA
jgi:nitrate/nitrite transporter NarK